MAAKKPAKPAAKPAARKAAKPAAKPVAAKKPVAKPAAKPIAAKKPAAKPVAKPVAKPAAKPVAAKAVTPKPAVASNAAVVKPVAKALVKPSTGKAATVAKEATKPKAPAAQAPAPKAPDKAVRPQGVRATAVVRKRGPEKVIPLQAVQTGIKLPKGYKPSAKEPYMSPFQTEYFRQRLLGWRGELVEESKQTIENLKEEVRDVGDEAERATRETENSLELRTRDRYRKLIGKIDDALKRIDDGVYGYCVDTGDEIGLDRLDARLTAERTIDAQERWEHRQKQMGD